MRPILYFIPFFFLLIAIEMWVAHRRGLKLYRLQDTITSLNIGTVSQFANTVGGIISLVMYSIIVERFGAFTWDLKNPLTWITALVLYDFFYYWVHRTGHEVNILWAAHVVHHSSEEFNLSTALRQSSTGFYFRWVFYIPLALLGFPVQVFIVVGLIDLVYQYWVHTQLIGRLGFLELFLVTPSNHRVHHGQNDYCIDKNYGGILSIWDRMFGTYADEREDEKPMYGVRKPLHSWNPIWGNVHHYVAIYRQARATAGWRNKLMCFFASPGWVPPEQVAHAETFEPQKFVRFATPSPQWMKNFAIVSSVIGTALLIHFLVVQTNLSMGQRIAYSAAVMVSYFLIGLAWLHPKVLKAAHE
jgi:sterol desaturase/sphingolipid hydroxylase (fatty acid hydroxylase superfamily)